MKVTKEKLAEHPIVLKDGRLVVVNEWRDGSLEFMIIPAKTVIAEAARRGMTPSITEASKALFLAYTEDAGNWSGTPLVGGNVCMLGEREDRGNLTQLKKAGLVETFKSDGNTWLSFTEAGREYAAQLGVDLSWTAR